MLFRSLDRAVAFAAAGADCVFTPGMSDPADIAALVRAVAPLPVNVLVSAPDPQLTVTRLADLGVRRISVGSALSRVAYGAFLRAARRLLADGEDRLDSRILGRLVGARVAQAGDDLTMDDSRMTAETVPVEEQRPVPAEHAGAERQTRPGPQGAALQIGRAHV